MQFYFKNIHKRYIIQTDIFLVVCNYSYLVPLKVTERSLLTTKLKRPPPQTKETGNGVPSTIFNVLLLNCPPRKLTNSARLKIKMYKYQTFCFCQCFGSGSVSGSALNLSPGAGSGFRMRIRIQQLTKLAPKAKIIHIIQSYLNKFKIFFILFL